ncbi:MAG: winged helix-turn-helix transcriptional regulator [Flavobacteriales bacterium]|nr:winged helix-turn-helix transcriptional regulator [Flavobacteriales bacterium]NQX99082.1 winged helix-turn-helix transcriptional regulator [Flavobacteriales bacterium]
MGTTKTTQFTAEQNRKAELYKALGHPARIAIIEFIIQQNSCVCGDIVDELPLSQSTISQHLAALKNVGIIKGDISGVKTCYCIDEEVWSELDEVSRVLVSSYSEKNKCC